VAAVTPADPLLIVKNLRVRFPTRTGVVEAVRGISFSVGREKVAIVGESGSGKSMTARAIVRLVPRPGAVAGTRLEFGGVDLLAADDRTVRRLRGRRIAIVLQDPRFSLNPVMSVGRQIAEAYRVHDRASAGGSRRRSLEMLRAVRIRDPERVYEAYPHELSGGMGQRGMIAMMLIPNPDLLIADEPTSALDKTVQMQILAILDDLVTQHGMGLIVISHDLGLVSSFCDRVLVMYVGRIVETIAAAELGSAKHPYTRGLLSAVPTFERAGQVLPVLRRDPAWLCAEE
jgi:peptide/nickel transport system ATP-binding protein